MFAGDDNAFKTLKSFAVAFFDFNHYANGVTNLELWNFGFHARLSNCF